MKKVELSNIEYPRLKPVRTEQRMYRVYLGEGKNNKFRSNREARAFLAETNRRLNLWMHEANGCYADLFGMYRHCWFYFLDKNKGVNRMNIEREIKASFEMVDEILNRLVHNTVGPNGNVFAFSFLSSAIGQLLNVAERLKEILVIRNELVNRYRVEVIITRLMELESRVNEYGLEKQV